MNASKVKFFLLYGCRVRMVRTVRKVMHYALCIMHCALCIVNCSLCIPPPNTFFSFANLHIN